MNYYNEFDPKAAAWLKQLIQLNLIPQGDVDTRSITEVKPHELTGYTQCHFFAGIGGWSYALQLAGWPTDRPVWSMSCPCQPFSSAGKGLGAADERHLWPVAFNLIKECRPQYVFGEQVASAIGHGWLDGVSSGLGEEGYACGSAVLGAHSVGAPHIRQRLYWMAHANKQGPQGRGCSELPECPDERAIGTGGNISRLAHTESIRSGEGQQDSRGGAAGSNEEQGTVSISGCSASGLGNPNGERHDRQHPLLQRNESRRNEEDLPETSRPCETGWSRYELIPCRDGKLRRIPAQSGIEPLLQRVVDGFPGSLDNRGAILNAVLGFPLSEGIRGRVPLLKGYGNAIVPQVAAAFIQASLGTLQHHE